MKLNLPGITLIVLSTLLIIGCSRTAPIYNIEDTPYPTWIEENVTKNDISKAIRKAGGSLSWIMQEKGDGHILGTLNIRNHTAIVDIYYDESKYSIVYKDSKDLLYNGTEIHKSYNKWVRNLRKRINQNLSQL